MGGLGFRRLHEFNLAMLSNKGGNYSLILLLWLHKYLRLSIICIPRFLHASLGSNPNYIWRSIWATQDLIRRNGRLRMGDDSGIWVAQGPWLLDAESGLISTNLGSAYANTTVCDLMFPKEQQWDIDLIIVLFNARDRNLILNIPLSCR